MKAHRRFPRLLALAALPFSCSSWCPSSRARRAHRGRRARRAARPRGCAPSDRTQPLRPRASRSSSRFCSARRSATCSGDARSRTIDLVDSLVDSPMALPPSVAGVALLVAFGRRGIVGHALESIGVHIAFTTAAVVLAQVFVAAPYFVRAAGRRVRPSRSRSRGLGRARRRDALACLPSHHRAARVADARRRLVRRLTWGARARRVRRDHHLRRQLSGADTNDAAGHLHRLRDRLHLAIALSVALLALSFAVLTMAKRTVRSGALVD